MREDKNPTKRPEVREKLREVKKSYVPWNKGKKTGPLSEKHKENIRKNHARVSGENHPMYGKHNVRLLEINKRKTGQNNPNYKHGRYCRRENE